MLSEAFKEGPDDVAGGRSVGAEHDRVVEVGGIAYKVFDDLVER